MPSSNSGIKVNAVARPPFLTVTNDGREMWGLSRPLVALAGGVTLLFGAGFLALTSVALFVGAPFIGKGASIKFNGREVHGFRRPLVAMLASLGGVAAAVGAAVAGVAVIGLGVPLSAVQVVTHGVYSAVSRIAPSRTAPAVTWQATPMPVARLAPDQRSITAPQPRLTVPQVRRAVEREVAGL